MKSEIREFSENHKFLEFLNREFDKTAGIATIEELAEFAFGSMEEAIESFKANVGREE